MDEMQPKEDKQLATAFMRELLGPFFPPILSSLGENEAACNFLGDQVLGEKIFLAGRLAGWPKLSPAWVTLAWAKLSNIDMKIFYLIPPNKIYVFLLRPLQTPMRGHELEKTFSPYTNYFLLKTFLTVQTVPTKIFRQQSRQTKM